MPVGGGVYGARQMPLNIRPLDMGKALSDAETIKNQRLQNLLTTNRLAAQPQDIQNTQRIAEQNILLNDQRLKGGANQLRAGNAALEFEKVTAIGQLMRGVTDQSSYETAIQRYFKMYPDDIGELRQIPRQYDPNFVQQAIQGSESEKMRLGKMTLQGQMIGAQSRENVAKMNLEGKAIGANKTRVRHEKDENGRWMKNTQEWDGKSWRNVDTVPLYKISAEERRTERQIGAIDKIESLEPNERYRQGWRIDDDGSLYIDAATGSPEKLPNFDKVLGKRGMVAAVKDAGEHYDDALEVKELLKNPEVVGKIESAVNAGLWDRARGRFSNEINQWMVKNGISKDDPTAELIIRISRMASEERKKLLGTAVTASELDTIQGWMPQAGDSFQTMIAKANVAAKEGEQVFKRFLDYYKDIANMSPIYSAFGLKRYNSNEEVQIKDEVPMAKSHKTETPMEEYKRFNARGDELSAAGMSDADVLKILQQEFSGVK